MNQNQKTQVLQEIFMCYPDQHIELNFKTPFQLLVAVMLSAQTTDIQVNKYTPELFQKLKKSEDIKNITLEELQEKIKSINFYKNKAKYIYGTAEILTKKYNGKIPKTLEKLTQLPGIGIKTAKVVLNQLYNSPYIAVDTHVHRVMNRLGFVNTKTPEETDKKIHNMFSEEEKRKMHHALVLFGRYICQAKKPQCPHCALYKKNLCSYSHKNLKI